MAEGYSVGQVVAQAVAATHSLDNAKIIAYLHSGVTLNSVQGPVKFDSKGENGAAAAFVFQWQKGNQVQVLPVGASRLQAAHLPEAELGISGHPRRYARIRAASGGAGPRPRRLT